MSDSTHHGRCLSCGDEWSEHSLPVICPECHSLNVKPTTSEERREAIAAKAREAGADHGLSAASWFFDGNTTDETYRRVLAGLEEGDPEIYEALPHSPLSGEYADTPTPRSVLEDLDVDEDDDAADDYLRAYEDGFSTAVHDDIGNACLAALDESARLADR